MTYVVYKWANSLIPTLNKNMIHFCKAPNKLFVFKISTISLRANFQKASIFFGLLDPKSGKCLICVAYMIGKYPWSIIRVVVYVYRVNKVFKMRDIQGYHQAPETMHF